MSVATARKILVTSALPYANGSLHLGHLLETIQTDIWVRFQNTRGHNCLYVCADDAHGTAIMLKAEQQGISAEQLIDNVRAEHKADFDDFLIKFDNFHSTHSDENKEISELIYNRLKNNGHIAERSITQLFDPEKELDEGEIDTQGAINVLTEQPKYQKWKIILTWLKELGYTSIDPKIDGLGFR